MASSSVERFSDKEEVDGSTPSSPTIMEKGFTQYLPEVDHETRREIFEDLRTKIVDSLGKHPVIRASWFFKEGSDVGFISRSVTTFSGACYKITRNTTLHETEVTIDRSGRRIGNPNIVLESIRFKFGRLGLREQDPLLEYHRALEKGGSRTVRNTIPAVKRIEKFVREFSEELGETFGI